MSAGKRPRSAFAEAVREMVAEQPWYIRALAWPYALLALAIYRVADHEGHDDG